MENSVGLAAAFAAGLVSFLSPCVLPLIPAYISFITGMSASELAKERAPLRVVLAPSLLFVAGFSLVFVALGASASLLGAFLVAYRLLLVRIAGGALLVLGFFMLGVIEVPWLYGEARFEMGKARAFGRGAALVMGMAFAFGWTPCVGPILGSILAVAGSSGSVGTGVLLLSAYSLGLGVPFVLVALLFGKLGGTLRWLGRHSLAINRVAGAVLIAVGVLMITGRLGVLSGWLSTVLPSVGL
ncbi:MAG: cytochrome c biogenesis protein CcdA [Actinomycetota bacterium]|nr:cytochrome c biogenesis protein CcdA [Actinomycetota bacterium]